MTVFKTFFKVLNKNKAFIIIYTSILLVFSISHTQTNENKVDYVDTKIDIIIVNNDDGIIAKDFTKYIKDNANLKNIKGDDEINDAIFYRMVDYVIYIPKNFSEDFFNGKEPIIDVKSTSTYDSTLAERLVSRYFKVLKTYYNNGYTKQELLSKIKKDLVVNVNTELSSKIDLNGISQIAYYFNFESYSIIACLIYIICLILSIFNNEKIRKRTIISSTDYKKNNRILLLANCTYSFVIWLFYTIVALILFKDLMFTIQGLIFTLNSFIFTMCITSLAFMIGNIIRNKDAISGITNVLAIGSSFLCGAFVPVEFLPQGVLTFAHILPTYYYINSNELLKTIEKYNYDTLLPIIKNSIMILIFTIGFIIISNIISKNKRKFG